MNVNIIRKLSSTSIVGVTLAALLSPSIASAQIPGFQFHRHPHYISARSDLRKAEQLLHTGDEQNVVAELNLAIEDVHRAIWEIDVAAVIDRKDIDDNPPIDTSLNHLNKFREIYKLLRRAERDIERGENNGAAIEWRNRAEANIDRAKHHVELAASRDVIDNLRSDRY